MGPRERLVARARRAYEWGRLRHAVLGAWLILPITAIAAIFGEWLTATLLAIPLLIASTWLRFAGRGLQRAVAPGWKAGLVPMVAALAVWQAEGAAGPCTRWCVPLCAICSVIVGAWLGSKMGRSERPAVAVASLGVAALTASLGCAVIGMGTLLGAIIGLSIGLGPAWAHRHATEI